MSEATAPPCYDSSVTVENAHVKLTYDNSVIQLSPIMKIDEKRNMRTPIDLVAVLDCSGSMETKIKGCVEMDGYTRMDIVRHAMNVIVTNLSEHDSFTLITFATDAEVVIPRMKMTSENVEIVKQKLTRLECGGSTNLYDGLETTFSYLHRHPLKQTKEEFVNRHIMILSDGCPNVPDEQQARSFSFYRELMETMYKKDALIERTLIHTFGITHQELDDKLLGKIAQYGHGMYGFISDPTIITPCFINVLGQWFNMLVTGLTLEMNDNDILYVPWILQAGTVDIQIPSSVVITDNTQFLLSSNVSRKMRLIVSGKRTSPVVSELFQLRQYVANELLDTCQTVQQKVKKLMSYIQLYEPESCLVSDLSNQDKEWLTKLLYDVNIYARIKNESIGLWGDKCLYSLGVSIRDDYVTNGYEKSFKTKSDPLLLHWISEVEAVAKNIIPPNPTFQKFKGDGGSNSSNNRRIPPPPPPRYDSSSSYFSSGSGRDNDDGCIDGNCIVEMADGSFKFVKNVVMGDKVVTDSSNHIGHIRCVLLVPSKEMVELKNGLRITHMHPVYCDIEGDWKFPRDVKGAKHISFENPIDMYSFILEEETSLPSCAMKINGHWVVHFSHHSKHKMLYHDFYGTNKIRNTVERIDFERNGRIHVTKALRNENDEVYDYEGFSY